MDNEHADLGEGAFLLKKGKTLDALRSYGHLLEAGDRRRDLYQNACSALVTSVSANSNFEDWSAGERLRFLEGLLLQVSDDETPPILHHSIARLFTSGARRAAENISALFAPAVEEILESGQFGKNLVLLMMLLRESLNRSISQKEISSLHLAWIDKFSLGDLTVPYNCMFDQETFWRNRDDVTSKLLPHVSSEVLFDRFSPYHLVFFEWLSQRHIGSFASGDWFETLKVRLDKPISKIDLAATRSLLVRHLPQDRKERLDELFLALGDKSLQAARSVASMREEVRVSSQPARASKRIGVRLFNNRLWQGVLAASSVARSRSPSIIRLKRKLKVAVCISGQLRGYDLTFSSWKRTLLRDVEHDIFVHSWTAIGRSGAEPFRYVLPFEGRHFTDTYRKLCNQIGIDTFRARYPGLFSRLADTGRVTEQAIADFYGTSHVHLDDDTKPPFSTLSNPEKMHHKIERCFGLVMESGNEYDLIIRLRPDKPVKYLGYRWDDLREVCHSAPILFADIGAGVHYANPMIGDQFAVGAPKPMQVYSSTFSSYPQLAAAELLNCKPSFTGHVSLAQVCWAHGINVRKAPIRFGRLQEPARLSTRMISECIEFDATGRMDEIDRQLIAAADKAR